MSSPSTFRLQVNIVDDDPFFSHLVKDALDDNEFLVVTSYPTAEDCLTADSNQPDVILLDHHLNRDNPDAMDGLVAITAFREKFPNVKIIMLTGQESLRVAEEMLALGAMTYVNKDPDAIPLIEKKLHKILLEI